MEYLRKYAADKKSVEVAPPSREGAPKFAANSASLPTRIGCSAGPQLKSPTNAPVDDVTAGTTPDRSISLTTMLGDSDNLSAIIVSFFSLSYDKIS